MPAKFPTPEWLQALHEKINTDEHYAKIASKWEGDLGLIFEPAGPLTEKLYYYLDLWHGKCRKVAVLPDGLGDLKPAFVATATYDNMVKILTGQLDPMGAMMTRKLHIEGNMVMLMRQIPTVLDFVRCCREVTSEIL